MHVKNCVRPKSASHIDCHHKQLCTSGSTHLNIIIIMEMFLTILCIQYYRGIIYNHVQCKKGVKPKIASEVDY